jgi:hypothetical protein
VRVGDGSPGSREAEGEGGEGFYIAQSGRSPDLLVIWGGGKSLYPTVPQRRLSISAPTRMPLANIGHMATEFSRKARAELSSMSCYTDICTSRFLQVCRELEPTILEDDRKLWRIDVI